MKNTINRSEQERSYADTVFVNGYVYTGDSCERIAETAAIKDGKIVFVGNVTDARQWIGNYTKVIDLEGKLLMPSFFEAHAHPHDLASFIFDLNLSEESSVEGYLKAVLKYLENNADKQAVKGNGWSNTLFPAHGPRKDDLDQISKSVPIAIWSIDHHSLWVNTKALELAHITKATPDPPNGVIERDETGEPSGTLRESAADLVMSVLPDYTVEEYQIAIDEYQKTANSLGFTGCFIAYLNPESNVIEAFKALNDSGNLKLRFRGAYVARQEDGLQQLEVFSGAHKKDNLGDLFQVNTIKFFQDGVIEGATAYLLEPYAEEAHRAPGFRGRPIWTVDELANMFVNVQREGFQIHVHSIGDASTKEILDAFEIAESINGKGSYRNAIAHLQLVDPADIERMKERSIIGVPSPYWAQKDNYFYNIQLPYLGEKRANQEYPLKSFVENGVLIASGSDFPITDPPNPMIGIQTAITRITPEEILPFVAADPEDPKFKEPLWPEEKIDLISAVKTFTYNGAYANFLEESTGSIEIGKSADMVVVDQNIFKVPAAEIGRSKILMTIFKGKIVFHEDHII